MCGHGEQYLFRGKCTRCRLSEYADELQQLELISSNQEATLRVLREALSRIRAASADPCIHAIVEAANTYHPMHEESWKEFP